MAKAQLGRAGSMVAIERWLGLNEALDGETRLRWGEAAAMRNFRITREGSLQIRPGYAPLVTLCPGRPVQGLWSGYVAGVLWVLAACGGQVWAIDPKSWQARSIGSVADAPTTFFGFARKVYVLDGTDYYIWPGTGELRPVEGYIPVVATATPPGGGGTLLEPVNKLTGSKRQQFSPDGTAKVFRLAEKEIDSVDRVVLEGVPATNYTADTAAGTVTFSQPPPEGINTLEITWTKGKGDRVKVTAMRYCELFNGAGDTRVFLYGDGSNQAIYSGLDEHGRPSAEYFPDLNVLEAGSANTPITALIRHFSRLIVFQSDSAYSVQYSPLTLSDGTVTAGFYVTPINRSVGHQTPGQIVLVENNPWTLFNGGAYEWRPSDSGLTNDERQARRRSDRVHRTLRSFSMAECVLFDDNAEQELYIVCGDRALVYHYAVDAWYYYDQFPALCLERVGETLCFGTPDGRIMHLSRQYRSNDTQPIDARWESGAYDFGGSWRRKTICQLFGVMQPESRAALTVTVETDRNSHHPQRVLACGLATFSHADFNQFSFGTNRKPHTIRLKLKAKRFAFYKLILSSRSSTATSTLLSLGMRVQEAGGVT